MIFFNCVGNGKVFVIKYGIWRPPWWWMRAQAHRCCLKLSMSGWNSPLSYFPTLPNSLLLGTKRWPFIDFNRSSSTRSKIDCQINDPDVILQIMFSRRHITVNWTIMGRSSLCYLMNGLNLMKCRRLGPKKLLNHQSKVMLIYHVLQVNYGWNASTIKFHLLPKRRRSHGGVLVGSFKYSYSSYISGRPNDCLTVSFPI